MDSDPAVEKKQREARLAPLAAMCQALTGKLLEDNADPVAEKLRGDEEQAPGSSTPVELGPAGVGASSPARLHADSGRFPEYRPDDTQPDIPEFLRLDPLKAERALVPYRRKSRSFRAPIWITASLVFVASAAVAGATYVTDFGFVAGLVDRSPNPKLSVRDPRGVEDTVIPLDITVSPAYGTELSELIVEGLPDGAVLSAGRHVSPGRWLLAPEALTNLSITPPENYSGTAVLFVTALAQLDAEQVESVESLTFVVEAVADAPHLRVTDASGAEDKPVRLDIAANVTDADETLLVTVADVPEGATLSHGRPVKDRAWAIEPGELADLTLTPPANFSGAFALRVAAMSSDGDDDVVVSRSIDVTVRPVADPAVLQIAVGPGREDAPVPVQIGTTLADPSESVSVQVSGLPDGAALTAGVRQDNGDWNLTLEDLADFAVVPPADFNGELGFAVIATSFDGADQTAVQSDQVVAVEAVADRPALEIFAATGLEDSAIRLPIAARPGAIGERLSVTIDDVPEGARLSAGERDEAGVWALEPADLVGLTLTPPADFSGGLTLRVVASSRDGADAVSRSERLEVAVAPVADVPLLTVSPASGPEDTEVDLTIGAQAADPSETVAVQIETMPPGATLSAGSADDTGGWTVPVGALSELRLIPPANFSGLLTLPVVAVATDGTDRAETRATLNVTVTAVADAPQLTVSDVAGIEDEPATVAISVRVVDEPEALSVWIEGLPQGGAFSAGMPTEDGRWVLPVAELADLHLIPPPHHNGSFELTAVAVTTDGDAAAETRAQIQVRTEAVADAPLLVLRDLAGVEDGEIPLAIDVETFGPTESVSVVVDNLPVGASLSAGTEIADGRWRVAEEELPDLRLLPPVNYSGLLEIGVVAEVRDGTDRAVTEGILNVSLSALADDPTLTINDVSGVEDEALPLAIAAVPGDVSEELVIGIAGLPSGAALTAGEDDGAGRWRLTPADLAGLALIPPRNFHGDMPLAIAATAFDGDTSATVTGDMVASFSSVADKPGVVTAPASGNEDSPIALSIAVTAEDPAEQLEIVVSGVPEGGSLSAGTAAEAGWVVAPEDIADLTFTAPRDFSGRVQLEVMAASVSGADRAETHAAFDVDVAPVADSPRLTVLTAAGAEDDEIPLRIEVASADVSETLAVEISGLPIGARLSAGEAIDTGRWSVPVADLDGLLLTPPLDFSGTLALNVTATSRDGADEASVDEALRVVLDPVADPPHLAVSNAFGPEDTAIPIQITGAVSDPSEQLLVTVEDVPEGATLTAGSPEGDGVWSVEPEALAGLMLMPPADFSGTFSLRVGTVAIDGEDRWEKTAAISVVVAPVADDPRLSAAAALGEEDVPVPLKIDAVTGDESEALAVRISGVPADGKLSAGTLAEDGTWSLTPIDLAGLSLIPPENYAGALELLVVAESRDGADIARAEASLGVALSPVADAALLETPVAEGREDQPLALSVVAAVADPSESLSLSIGNLPEGAVLSAGVADDEGGYALTPADLVDLSLVPPKNFSGAFSLTVVAETTDGPDVRKTKAPLDVVVAAAADAPVVSVADVAGTEDEDVSLAIAAAPGDPSETLAISVDGVPPGARLSVGEARDGKWALGLADLKALSLSPPRDFSGQLPLSVVVAATDGDDRRVTEHALTVTIEPRADVPALSVNDALGIEDGTIALDIVAAVADPSEELAVILEGVPAAAALSAGVRTDDGVWTLSAAELPGLAMSLPADFNGEMVLDAVAKSIDGTDTAVLRLPLKVIVAPVADVPVIGTDSLQGRGGDAIPVPIDVPPGAASERVFVGVGGLPTGVTLSAGEGTADGGWALTDDDLENLSLTTPVDYEGSFILSFSIAAIDGNDRKDVEHTLEVTVSGEAETEIAVVVEPDTADGNATEAAVVTESQRPFETINALEPLTPPVEDSLPATRAITVKPAAGPATTASRSTLSQGELEGLTARGNELLKIGDIFSARLMFELAARSDYAAAGLGLGKTYDPVYFSDANVVGAAADPEKAKHWYGIARDLGNAEAGQRLALLLAWLGEDTPSEVIDVPPAFIPQGGAPANTATARRVF